MPPRSRAARTLAAQAAAAIRRVVVARREGSAHGRDSLTGLLDGRALHDALSAAIDDAQRRGEALGLLFLDLDFFKRVNDRHGHQAGSHVLRQVATLLQTAAADDAGGFAARYGGDEFVLVLPGTDIDQAFGRAERLRTDVASTLFSSGPGAKSRPLVSLTCSIGAASLLRLPGTVSRGDCEESATRLLRQADDAMYAAKGAGRNRVVATDTRATGAA